MRDGEKVHTEEKPPAAFIGSVVAHASSSAARD
jgi:hypothetical protein